MVAVRRWAATVMAAVLIAGGCVAAGVWQWHRHVARDAAIALVERNYGAPSVPLADLVDRGPLDPDRVWRTASVTGHYLGAPVLLRNRPVDSQPAFHVLAPFEVGEGPLAGSVLVVDRGWVPAGEDGATARDVPGAPTGRVDVHVRLRAPEPDTDRLAPAGQVQTISPDRVRAAAATAWPAAATLAAYGVLVSEDGRLPTGVGPLEQPSLDPGPHLSYAFQWWVFALGALVGCVVLIRRDAAENRPAPVEQDVVHGPGGSTASGGPSRPRRRPRGPSAEEEEDALLDAQGGG
ncbi:MAG TPA: SURF1 family protein [Actinotalea sp.]|jgi:cytochrome oxidase assembly protein ShyY1